MTLCLKAHISSMRYPAVPTPENLIEDLTFQVAEGQVVSFLGPSGCGKTTLLRILAGLERRFQGSVLLDGEPLTRPSRRIQFVFQDGRLLPWRTVTQNLLFAVGGRQAESDGARRIVQNMLGVVELIDKGDCWPKTLSGGEESRVGLARALLSPPRVLLLDEPFRALDSMVKFRLQHRLVDMWNATGVTVVHTSHNVDDAVFLSDTVYCVSTRPMKISKVFDVDIPRPRQQGDRRLAAINEAIVTYMLGK